MEDNFSAESERGGEGKRSGEVEGNEGAGGDQHLWT